MRMAFAKAVTRKLKWNGLYEVRAKSGKKGMFLERRKHLSGHLYIYLSGVTRRVTLNRVSQSSCDEGHVFRSFWEGRAESDEWLSSPMESEVFSTTESQTLSSCKKQVYREQGKVEKHCILRREDYCLFPPHPPLPFQWVPWVCQHRKFLLSLEYSWDLHPLWRCSLSFLLMTFISYWVTEWTIAGANLRKESR